VRAAPDRIEEGAHLIRGAGGDEGTEKKSEREGNAGHQRSFPKARWEGEKGMDQEDSLWGRSRVKGVGAGQGRGLARGGVP